MKDYEVWNGKNKALRTAINSLRRCKSDVKEVQENVPMDMFFVELDKLEETLETYSNTYRRLIQALQCPGNVCEYGVKMEYEGRDSHYSYEKCPQCGKSSKR